MNIIITAIGTHAHDGSFRVHGRGAIVDVIETPNGEFSPCIAPCSCR
jgi:hypothetical protein